MSATHPSHRRLPRGVTPGVRQYTQAGHIADQYDDYFSHNHLFELDQQVAARHFTTPGLVVDLGCGTGRILVGLARRGFRGLGIDLSRHMLRIVGRKAAQDDLPIACLQANLVELDCLRDRSADYCTCLFSTLGMIRGRENRHRVLTHARRILKPAGRFVVHVHNLWYGLFDAVSRRWLARQLLASLLGRGVELGDKLFEYRGIPGMFLHTFTQRELVEDLSAAGFRIEKLIPLGATRQRPLPHPWFFGRLRANGWIVVCQK